MMSIEPHEAKEQLALIEQAQLRTRAVGGREVSLFLIIWGTVWLVGFVLSQYAPSSWLLWIWLLLSLSGGIASALVGMKLGQQVQYEQTGPKMGLFYPALMGFGLLWLFLARPAGWQQTAILAISFVGFAVVASGILVKERTLIMAGAGGTVLAVAVYLLFQPLFGLILGIVGGGSMVLAGLRLRRVG